MANPGERIMRASCNEDSVVVELADGRTTSLVIWKKTVKVTHKAPPYCDDQSASQYPILEGPADAISIPIGPTAFMEPRRAS